MFLIRFVFILALGATVQCVELKGLQLLFNLISGDTADSKARDEEESSASALSRGYSNYTFIDYVSYRDHSQCGVHDNESIVIADQLGSKKPVIKVKCIPGYGNSTVQVVGTVNEVVDILAPYGNSTKRNVEGHCALVLFYTRSCPGSAMVSPHYNAFARQFPDVKIAAIDAFKFRRFNTEFGIVGLPTIMLFHQGKPVVKFNDTATTVITLAKFVSKHTGIKSMSTMAFVTSDDFNGPLSNKIERDQDLYLYLAWAFILCCAGFQFTKTALYLQIIEMIKRNWRESEAQLERS